jgi:hypothetical protein
MTRLRILADSARPLADVLIDAPRTSSKLSRLRAPFPSEDDQARQQYSLQLEEETDDRHADHPIQVLHPDDVATAVLLGQAFERSRDALARLADPDIVAVIEVPHPGFVEPVVLLLRKYVLGPETSVLDGDSLDKQPTAASPGMVIIFKRTDEAKPRKAWAGGAGIAAAAQLRSSLVGIAADPSLLPQELVSLAEHRIVVPPIDGAVIATVIEAVTGRNPDTIDYRLARRATLEALSIAVRSDLGAERSMDCFPKCTGSDQPNNGALIWPRTCAPMRWRWMSSAGTGAPWTRLPPLCSPPAIWTGPKSTPRWLRRRCLNKHSLNSDILNRPRLASTEDDIAIANTRPPIPSGTITR